MIQDIAPHAYHNEFRADAPQPGDLALVYGSEGILCRNGELGPDASAFPTVAEAGVPAESCTFLFDFDGKRFFLAPSSELGCLSEHAIEHGPFPDGFDDAPEPPDGFAWNPLKRRGMDSNWIAYAAITGQQLAGWYRDHARCGRCGAPTHKSLRERAIVCDSCSLTVYPVISPAVIVAIIDEDRLLMTRYAGRRTGHYALVAGFNEIGETIEQTVVREVREEVGLELEDIHYYKSQPWPFSSSLLFGFTAKLAGSPRITLQESELAEAAWVPRGQIEEAFDNMSLTNEMIVAFKEGRL